MSERVSTYDGKTPCIILAPHGYDDKNTSIIAEIAIKELGCCGVINRGWRKSSTYDYSRQMANCNNIEHIHKDVVKNEFLMPIMRHHARLRKENKYIYMFSVHGVSNVVRKIANNPTLDLIIGCGAGNPAAYTCDKWRRNLFTKIINDFGITVYEGGPRSRYAARHKNNLTQLFNMGYWYPDDRTQSMQLEFVHDIRSDELVAEITGSFLSDAIKQLLKQKRKVDHSDPRTLI